MSTEANRGQKPARKPRRERDDDPVLPDTTSDERDRGWGDDDGRRDADWYRSQRPPHHGE
jgi:hypothetical protein